MFRSNWGLRFFLKSNFALRKRERKFSSKPSKKRKRKEVIDFQSRTFLLWPLGNRLESIQYFYLKVGIQTMWMKFYSICISTNLCECTYVTNNEKNKLIWFIDVSLQYLQAIRQYYLQLFVVHICFFKSPRLIPGSIRIGMDLLPNQIKLASWACAVLFGFSCAYDGGGAPGNQKYEILMCCEF